MVLSILNLEPDLVGAGVDAAHFDLEVAARDDKTAIEAMSLQAKKHVGDTLTCGIRYRGLVNVVTQCYR